MTIGERLLSCAQRTPGLKKCVAPVRPENRTVFVGGKYVEFCGLDSTEKYCDNLITTTKYTPWNFIFKNLYEQFLRIANFYFLIVSIIMLCVPNTPVSAVTSIAPLVFVLFVTAVKQAYEDWLRRKQDNEVNLRICRTVKDGHLSQLESRHIQVGDIVRVEDGEPFPCDLVLLSSSNDQGQCSVTTANLDGETNLKTFVCLPETKDYDTPAKLSSIQGVIDCQQPITDLYKFVGKLTLYSSRPPHVTKALLAQNVLLRGAKLKNTDYIYGCAVYTGPDTKLALNSNMTSVKRSRIETKLNTYLLVFLAYMFIQCLLSTCLRYWSLATFWVQEDGTRGQWYLPFQYDYGDEHTERAQVTAKYVIIDFLYFYIIYNYVIPISLYVTIELQKFVGSMFFALDCEMYDEKLDERAKANTSDLNEELGQVEYLFCDKTGTLTENDMQFRQCSINGRLYIEDKGTFCRAYEAESQLQAEKSERERVRSRSSIKSRSGSTKSRTLMSVQHQKIVEQEEAAAETATSSADSEDQLDSGNMAKELETSFFEVLSLCHTVQIEDAAPTVMKNGNGSHHTLPTTPDSGGTGATDFDNVDGPMSNGGVGSSKTNGDIGSPDGSEYQYNAASPDEKALVEACRLFGIVYHGSTDNKLRVTFNGKIRYFTLHQVLEFDSDRKCMSVIIETDKGEYQVMCKGAESSVLQKCVSGPIDETIEHVDYYAGLGLRTLVIASKTISGEEFSRLMNLIETAKQDLDNRDEALVAAYLEVEQGFHVIGATAVEDKLQDGVKETIEKLRMAGIKVWVLTGDKEETAVNISHSAGHFDNSMAMLGFTCQTSEADAYGNLLNLKESLIGLENEGSKVALVVDGSSLAMIMNRYLTEFREVCLRCSTVLCCRMTPIQKAKVVRMVKESASNPCTAAIGDGANDVSMIQEAHVGLGIMGKEGRQASRSSDYTFGRFRFLLRAFLVHGHYFYIRLAIMVQYFFYKNVAFITANFIFIFFSAYSALSVFDSVFLTFYNVTFTSLPIFLFGLFENHMPQEVLLEKPHLYRRIVHNKRLNWPRFIAWTLSALWTTCVASFGVYLTYSDHNEFSNTSGRQTDMNVYGTAILFISSTAVNIKLMIETYYFTWITLAGYLITFVGNWAMVGIYSAAASTFSPSTGMFGVFSAMFGSGMFWFTALLLITLAVLPDLTVRAYHDMTDPVYRYIARDKASRSTRSTPSKHVMFINSDESICMGEMTSHPTKKPHRGDRSNTNSDNGIAVIGHRYIGEGYNNTSDSLSGGGGGHDNKAMVHETT